MSDIPIKPIVLTGRDAEFSITDQLRARLLNDALMLSKPVDFEVLPGSFSAAAITIQPRDSFELLNVYQNVVLDNAMRAALGLPLEFRLPKRKPTCEWMDDE